MLYPLLTFADIIDDDDIALSKTIATITFQVTEDCNLNCSYCYQGHKTKNTMPFQVAKIFIDNLLSNATNKDAYFSIYNVGGLEIEFIGGEPLLEVDLIGQIIDYFEEQFNNKYTNLSWAFYHAYSLTTNGILYFTTKVQEFLEHYSLLLDLTITVDGCKKAHNKCRLTKSGLPTYDEVIKAAIVNKEVYNNYTTKLTISPDNIEFLSESIISLITLGFSHIMANFIFEEGWTNQHASICFKELQKVNDWIIENNMFNFCYISLLDIKSIQSSNCDQNWCGCNSSMLAVDYRGNIYPCIRFMHTSLNQSQPPYIIGNIYDGLKSNYIEQERMNNFCLLTYKNQCPPECLNCFCSKNCSWCPAYNYQYFGDITQKTTFHCELQKACAMATYDLYQKLNHNTDYVPNFLIENFLK